MRNMDRGYHPEEPHHWKLFQDACRYRGMGGALSLLPVSIRPAYQQALDSAKGALWRPEKLWDHWHEALEGAYLTLDTGLG